MAWIEEVEYFASDFELKIPRWDFPESGISCIFGESGSGKTTLLQIMAGLLPAKYKLCVGGEILSDISPGIRNIGFVFQDYALFPHMTTYENLAFAGEAKKIPKEVWLPQVEKLSSRLDLGPIRNQKARYLSGGEQQRVALARALVTKPKLVLLDEPFSSLDESRKDEARALIKELAREFCVPFILVTHDIRDVRLLSQNLLCLKQGQVLGFGATFEILSKPENLSLARAIPENQFIEASEIKFPVKNILSHEGQADILLYKPWSFQITDKPTEPKLSGEVIEIFNLGPHLACTVRLSGGQIIKAMAPLNMSPKGKIELNIDSTSLVLYRGTLR